MGKGWGPEYRVLSELGKSQQLKYIQALTTPPFPLCRWDPRGEVPLTLSPRTTCEWEGGCCQQLRKRSIFCGLRGHRACSRKDPEAGKWLPLGYGWVMLDTCDLVAASTSLACCHPPFPSLLPWASCRCLRGGFSYIVTWEAFTTAGWLPFTFLL